MEEPEPEEKVFTFHHVSIKTDTGHLQTEQPDSFTFHHVSIKTSILYTELLTLPDSHSTMYLLKLGGVLEAIPQLLHSHSTMYLLKRIYQRV